MGRPPLPAHQRRSERLVVMMTPAEAAQMEELARVKGKSASSLAHAILTRALKRRNA